MQQSQESQILLISFLSLCWSGCSDMSIVHFTDLYCLLIHFPLLPSIPHRGQVAFNKVLRHLPSQSYTGLVHCVTSPDDLYSLACLLSLVFYRLWLLSVQSFVISAAYGLFASHGVSPEELTLHTSSVICSLCSCTNLIEDHEHMIETIVHD